MNYISTQMGQHVFNLPYLPTYVNFNLFSCKFHESVGI
jgi:hypothetical protein